MSRRDKSAPLLCELHAHTTWSDGWCALEDIVYSWVASEGRPGIATGDFHRPDHLASWKTLLPCAKDERAVVGYLASPRPAFLVPVGAPEPVSLAA